LYEKNGLYSKEIVDSGTWRKAGGDLGDFVDSSNIRIYSGVLDSYTKLF
jgi:hypothetical protein